MHRTRLCAYKTLVLAAAAAALVLVTGWSTAQAQDSLDHVYFLAYYANANTPGAPDGTLRLANDANVSESAPAGDLWAAIYVFDDGEQLVECCSCVVTPNGYSAISVNALTSDPVTPKTLHRGLIEILSTNNGNPAAPVLRRGIRAWITHPETLATKGQYSLSVEQLTDSTLGSSEAADLSEDCGIIFMLTIDSGQCWHACADAGR